MKAQWKEMLGVLLVGGGLVAAMPPQVKQKAKASSTSPPVQASGSRLVAGGHPELTVVHYEPASGGQSGKITLRATNPSCGDDYAPTRGVTVRLREGARPFAATPESRTLPTLGRTQSVEISFDLPSGPAVQGNPRLGTAGATLSQTGLSLSAETTLIGTSTSATQSLLRWPRNEAYHHETMNVRGPFERTLDTTAPPAGEDAPVRAVRSGNEHAAVAVRPAAGRPSAGLADSTATPMPATILQGVFLADAAMGGLDTNVAAGPSAVLVMVSRRMAFYTKSGQPLRSRDGSKELGTFKMTDFFSPLVEDLKANLQLSQAFRDKGFDDCDYYDSRCMYDPYRKRFWIVSLVTNKFVIDDSGNMADQVARRNKIACAVSKTSDPRDGFWMFWWDATPYDGQSGTDWKAGDRGDYPSIGISPRFMMQTNHVRFKHLNDDGSDARWAMVTLVNADALATGQAQSGWMFPRLKNVDGSQIYHISMPAMHYGPSPSNRAYLTQHNGDRLLVYGFDAYQDFPRIPKRASLTLRPAEGPPDMAQKSSSNVPNPPKIKLSNVGTSLMRTVVRGDRLWTVFQEGVTWSGQSTALPGIRLIRVGLGQFVSATLSNSPASGYFERTFGKRNQADPAGDVFGYGMPAVEVDQSGNALVSYVRSGSTIFQEARFTFHPSAEADVRPSMRLRAGEGTLPGASNEVVGQLDCVGAALDPDGRTFWVAVPYAHRSSNSSTEAKYRIAVGRIRL